MSSTPYSMDAQGDGFPDFTDANETSYDYDENGTSVHLSAEILCWLSYLHTERNQDLNYCNPVYDLIQCWPMVPENTTINKSCPPEINAPDEIRAYRTCGPDGEWTSNTTDYSQCIEYMSRLNPVIDDTALAIILRDIYFVCSIVSLVFLIISLFIFCRFKSLSCSRISIHKQLAVSFIIRFLVLITMIEPFVLGHQNHSYSSIEWLCKVVSVLNQYTVLTNIYWMLVEGLFLHNSIVVSVFSTEEPYKLFLFMGWGVPAIIAGVWATVTHFTSKNYCWSDNSKLNTTFIIIGPFLAALIINLIFLISIIRVLVTKLRANNTHESSRIKKAIKATVILMPLLGLTNMVFLWNPEDGGTLQIAYHVTNAVLHSTQGILISCLYCFLNAEVRRVVRRKYNRFKIQRFLKNSGRRRSSRTSSFILSQTEVQDISELSSMNRRTSTSSDSNACTPFNGNNNRYQKIELIAEKREEEFFKHKNCEKSSSVERSIDIDEELDQWHPKQLTCNAKDSQNVHSVRFDSDSETEKSAKSKVKLNGKVNSAQEKCQDMVSEKDVNGSCIKDVTERHRKNITPNEDAKLCSIDKGDTMTSIVGGLSDELTDEFSKILLH